MLGPRPVSSTFGSLDSRGYPHEDSSIHSAHVIFARSIVGLGMQPLSSSKEKPEEDELITVPKSALTRMEEDLQRLRKLVESSAASSRRSASPGHGSSPS
jgi:hypothetical protein